MNSDRDAHGMEWQQIVEAKRIRRTAGPDVLKPVGKTSQNLPTLVRSTSA